MKSESVADQKPPYVSYATFKNTLEGWRQSVLPSRVDRSTISWLAGGVQTQLISALKFLGLVNEQGVPTADFKALVEGDDASRKETLKKVIETNYDFVLTGGLDLQRATEAQLGEKFKEKDVAGDTVRKCQSFFIMLCEDAGIAFGPHIRGRNKGAGTASRVAPSRRKYKKRSEEPSGGAGSAEVLPASVPKTTHQMLLDKFPPFDPAWPDPIKTKWFEGFEKLMKSAGE